MLNIKEIVNVSNGRLINGSEVCIVNSYKIDSREAENGDFFIPIVGEKVDAHNYIIDCVKKGISGFFIEKYNSLYEKIISDAVNLNKNINIIEVENSQFALYNIAKYNRMKYINIPIIAITGSVGKTSTREMVASVVKTKYNNVLVTEKNYNSFIGASLMALKIEAQDICVLELGIDKFGEMSELSELIKPDIAVITNIGTSHIAAFKTKENIFLEKYKITQYLKGYKKLIVNGDNEYLKKLENTNKIIVNKFCLDECDNVEIDIEKIKFETNIYNKKYSVVINQIGEHNIYNALCAIKVGEILEIPESKILKGISNYKNFSKRLEKKLIKNNIILVDDTYNASIDSMKSGLITVSKLQGNRKFAVLGDMLELGDYSEKLHSEVGKIFKICKYDYLYTFGKYSKYINESAKDYIKPVNNVNFGNKQSLINAIEANMKANDVIYFKASNGMRFFDIIDKLVQKYNTDM